MNIIKKVIVIVTGIVVIGVISTTIATVTQTRVNTIGKSVTFKLLDDENLENNTFDKVSEYAIYDGDRVTNFVSISINGNYNMFDGPYMDYYADYFIYDMNDNLIIEFSDSNSYTSSDSINVGDTISITFDVEVEAGIPPFVKTLIILIPLVLTASLIGYISFFSDKGGEL